MSSFELLTLVFSVTSVVVSFFGVYYSYVISVRGVAPCVVTCMSVHTDDVKFSRFYEFGVESVGSGVALIKGVDLYYKGDVFTEGVLYADLPRELVFRCVSGRLPAGVSCVVEASAMPSKIGALQPGKKFIFAKVRFDFKARPVEADFRVIEVLFSDADYVFRYASIHGGKVLSCGSA